MFSNTNKRRATTRDYPYSTIENLTLLCYNQSKRLNRG